MSDSPSSHSPSPSSCSSRSKPSIGSRFMKPFRQRKESMMFAPSAMKNRKTSDPTQPTQPPHFSQPTPLTSSISGPGFSLLSIDTFGGETAGSGLDYFSQLVDEETSCNQSTKRAQLLALSKMRNAQQNQQKRLEEIELDEIRLNTFAEDEFREELAYSEDEVQRYITTLETELENLRAICPAAVPPPIPARPLRTKQCEEWICVKCNSVNFPNIHRCFLCHLPRLAICPSEAVDCACHRCSEYVAGRLSVVSDQGTDWMLVSPTDRYIT